MKLFKWKKNLKPKFSGMVEKFFGYKMNNEVSDDEFVSTIPSVNIEDNEKSFDLKIAVPGMSKKDINVEINGDLIYITSEKQFEKEEQEKDFFRKEFAYASFQRIFELPDGADKENIKADLKNGILSISIPKNEEYLKKHKKITVK